MKRVIMIVAAALLTLSASAQELANFAMGGGAKKTEINADGTVTFRFVAPKAIEVLVTGNCFPTEAKELFAAAEENAKWRYKSYMRRLKEE